MRFRVLLHQNYTSVTPIIYRRQTTFIIEVTSQKSTICEKIQKKCKKSQKLWFFENFWLLWLLTSLRGITPLPVLDQSFFWKKVKKFQKSSCGDDFFQKVAILPPQLAKSATKNTLIKMRQKILSVSQRFGPACKFLAIFNG